MSANTDELADPVSTQPVADVGEAQEAQEAQLEGAAPPTPPPGAQPGRAAAGLALRARAVPGVTYAAAVHRWVPVGDSSPVAQALATRGAFAVTAIAAPLGKLLQLGDLHRTAISSPGEQLLLLHSSSADSFLAVVVSAGVSLVDTETALRRALSASAAG
jgi:hypothetical protein